MSGKGDQEKASLSLRFLPQRTYLKILKTHFVVRQGQKMMPEDRLQWGIAVSMHLRLNAFQWDKVEVKWCPLNLHSKGKSSDGKIPDNHVFTTLHRFVVCVWLIYFLTDL